MSTGSPAPSALATILMAPLVRAHARAQGQPTQKAWRMLVEAARRALVLAGDPAYRAEVRGVPILLPASHKLPIYTAQHALYDTLPPRISRFLRARQGRLVMVDVGANVGDTILLCQPGADDRVLAVEAHHVFAAYLRANTAAIRGVDVVEALCGSLSREAVAVEVHATAGTASVSAGRGARRVRAATLDELVAEQPGLGTVGFVKVDTDGHDFDVLAGASRTLASTPIVLFECDVATGSQLEALGSTLRDLAATGYTDLLVYDNLGELRVQASLGDPAALRASLLWQTAEPRRYLDLVALAPAHAEFASTEAAFFASRATSARQDAAAALAKW